MSEQGFDYSPLLEWGRHTVGPIVAGVGYLIRRYIKKVDAELHSMDERINILDKKVDEVRDAFQEGTKEERKFFQGNFNNLDLVVKDNRRLNEQMHKRADVLNERLSRIEGAIGVQPPRGGGE